MSHPDIPVLRDLARQYADIAADPVQERRRELWRQHNALQPTPVPLFVLTGTWDLWCRQAFGDHALHCQDPLFRDYERQFRLARFFHEMGDDRVAEPWITVQAVQARGWGTAWGVEMKHEDSQMEGGAWHFDPVIRDIADFSALSWPPHAIDEAATAARVQKLGDAIGDILPIHTERGPLCQGFLADIAMALTQLRGLEQVMLDMCEQPEALHRLLAWMRDGILANQAAAEAAGDLSLTTQQNQCAVYADGLPAPRPESHGARRKQLWAFAAAQELTGVSPAMHEEFMLQYQRPIMEQWGLSAYGCCEDLTSKIGILRRVKNLRIIAVSPRADLRRCAEQIGTDYVISWRPNPTDMVSFGFDEQRIRRILREGLAAARGCRLHINLKDIYTLEGDPTRLARWVKIAREETARWEA